jgi:DNA-binding transcriptional ArsR family regulator
MTYGETLDALADQRRRAIFELLRKGPRSVGEIAQTQPVSRPAVSQHLKVLMEAGLVHARPKGTRRLYEADRAGLMALREWIDGFWDDVLDRFAAEVSKQMGGSGNEPDRT